MSRLSDNSSFMAFEPEKVAGFYFKRFSGGDYLLTNDWGYNARLSEPDFKRFLSGLSSGDPLWNELGEKGFIRDHMDFEELSRQWRRGKSSLWQGAVLHVVVVTLRCNQKCVYCQASAVGTSGHETDMSLETAKGVVDLIFQSPNPYLTIEFQGGEPLLNWPVVRFIIEYAEAKNKKEKRKLLFAMVSNMSLMDEEKLDFLLDHEVSLCTSLDGPQDLHEKNRVYLNGGSYGPVIKWIREILSRQKRQGNKRIFKPSALMTTTRFSLSRAEDIVDEYQKLGLDDIFLRPLSPMGHAKKLWPQIGYGINSFLEFYRKGLDRILEINFTGRNFVERAAFILLKKILYREDPGFTDLRSPCGAVTGQLAYNYDGGVYTCDEGRMVAKSGDNLFKVGHLDTKDYAGLLSSPACRALCIASNLDVQPACSRCVYKPYCGVCPVYNYQVQDSLWGRMPENDRCSLFMGICDILFEKIEDSRCLDVFNQWVKAQPCEAEFVK